MSILKTLGVTIGLAFAASSFAIAQQNNPAPNPQSNPAATQQGNPAGNAPAGSAGGTHQAGQKTGNAASSEKSAHNQHANAGNHHRHRRLFSFYRGGETCHVVHHPVSGRVVTVCHR